MPAGRLDRGYWQTVVSRIPASNDTHRWGFNLRGALPGAFLTVGGLPICLVAAVLIRGAWRERPGGRIGPDPAPLTCRAARKADRPPATAARCRQWHPDESQ